MLLNIQNISKAFGKEGESTYQAVIKDLSLDLDVGESLAILGPSGSGKSTLLNIIGALDQPDAGSLMFKDQAITSLGPKELDHFRNQEIGFVFQFHHLLPQCNVLENVLIPSLVNKAGRKDSAEYAETLLKRVGLWEHRHKHPGQLSGGECQRVAVVRAMINRPSLILADEPTGALDKKNVEVLSNLLLELNSTDKIAMILVTHSDSLAAKMSRILTLDDGQLKNK